MENPKGGLALKKYTLLLGPTFVTVLLTVTVPLSLWIARDGQLRSIAVGSAFGHLNVGSTFWSELLVLQKQRRQSVYEASYTRPGSAAFVGRKWPDPYANGVASLPDSSVNGKPKLFLNAAASQKCETLENVGRSNQTKVLTSRAQVT